MDGNRTHPGRLIGAPQTVLKTAGRTSTKDRAKGPQAHLATRYSQISVDNSKSTVARAGCRLDARAQVIRTLLVFGHGFGITCRCPCGGQ